MVYKRVCSDFEFWNYNYNEFSTVNSQIVIVMGLLIAHVHVFWWYGVYVCVCAYICGWV